MTVAVGHFPDGDEEAMRQLGGHWSGLAAGCRDQAARHDAAASGVSCSIEGDTGAGIAHKHRESAGRWRNLAVVTDAVADQLFEGADAIEFEKLVIIGTALVLATQMIVDSLMVAAGGALKVIADRAVAELTMRTAWQVLLQRMAAICTRPIEERTLAHLAGRAGLIGAVQGGGVNIAAQAYQLGNGHRESIDIGSALIATASGAAGGAGGMAAARRIAPAVSRLMNSPAATRAGGVARAFGSMAVLGGTGGVVGGIVGACIAVPLSGGKLDAGGLADAVIPGLAGGLLGAAGAGTRAARSGAAALHFGTEPAVQSGLDGTVAGIRPSSVSGERARPESPGVPVAEERGAVAGHDPAERHSSANADEHHGKPPADRPPSADIPAAHASLPESAVPAADAHLAEPGGEAPGQEPRPHSEKVTLPQEVRDTLRHIDDADGDPVAKAHAKAQVAERFRENLEVQAHRQYWDRFKDAMTAELRAGTDGPLAEQIARQQATDFVATSDARATVAAEASAFTTRWAERIGPAQIIQDVWLHGPGTGETAAAPPSAAGLPPVIASLRSEINTTPHADYMKSAAFRLVEVQHDKHLAAARNTTARKQGRENLAGFAQAGIPEHLADSLASAKSDAYLRTAMAGRLIRQSAETKTRAWATRVSERAAEWNEDTTRWLARIDNVNIARDLLRTVESQATAIEATRPGLLDRVLARVKNLDAYAPNLDTLFRYIIRDTRAEFGPQIIKSMEWKWMSDVLTTLRGLSGETGLIERLLPYVDAVGKAVSYPVPGQILETEIDAVTHNGNYWREVKNVFPQQSTRLLDGWAKQAELQLVIAYRNQEHWVHGEPPKIKWHVLNGVHPEVKRRLEEIRIRDTDGNLVPDHFVEVLDGY
ncbi:WXG100-like domain-containing protein [Nocardia colli]|uniref:WXG100-like domain-containing protein n=1 Tax=Nocardia colli TaxID=2545717 RepID=UPI0035DBEAF2